MDHTDQLIVSELQADARVTTRALAARVGLAPSSTAARVRDLERRGVITGYHATVDLEAVGRPIQAMVFVKLSPTDEDTINAFLAEVSSMEETVSVFVISGVEDAIVHVAVGDVRELRDTVVRRISAIPAVADERTSLVFDEIRSTPGVATSG